MNDTRLPVAITTSVMENQHDDGVEQWIVTTVVCDDGTIWRHDAVVDAWYRMPSIPRGFDS